MLLFEGNFTRIYADDASDYFTVAAADVGNQTEIISVILDRTAQIYRADLSNPASTAVVLTDEGDHGYGLSVGADGRIFYGSLFGQNGDVPVAADYDGDGKADIAVFRPTDGAWYRLNLTNGGFSGQLFGFSTDKLIPAAFLP